MAATQVQTRLIRKTADLKIKCHPEVKPLRDPLTRVTRLTREKAKMLKSCLVLTIKAEEELRSGEMLNNKKELLRKARSLISPNPTAATARCML